jgi:hypothetical protein
MLVVAESFSSTIRLEKRTEKGFRVFARYDLGHPIIVLPMCAVHAGFRFLFCSLVAVTQFFSESLCP